ncbi:MAG: hypothetical protein HFE66_00955 [Clostridiales bacterium]|jgi:hypothetical protein|nr:hypothetical protein [Clostridiales bacterium]
MARSIIRDRIEDLGMTNKQIIELLFREKGERISPSKFSGSIKKNSCLLQPREEQIVKMTSELLDRLEQERK